MDSCISCGSVQVQRMELRPWRKLFKCRKCGFMLYGSPTQDQCDKREKLLKHFNFLRTSTVYTINIKINVR